MSYYHDNFRHCLLNPAGVVIKDKQQVDTVWHNIFILKLDYSKFFNSIKTCFWID